MRNLLLNALASSAILCAQTTLTPRAVLDATVSAASVLPSRVFFDGVRLVGDEIYASYKSQVQPRKSGVIRLSMIGALLGSVSLPVETSEVVIDEAGKLTALVWLPDKTMEVRLYSPEGQVVTSHLLSGIYRALTLGGTPILLRSDGVMLPCPGPPAVSFPAITISGLSRRFHLTEVNDHTVAIVDAFQPTMNLVDIAASSVRPVVIDAPAVSEAMRKTDTVMAYAPTQTARPLLFFAASGSNGHLYLAVSGTKIADGMSLIEVGQEADLIGSFRLLPAAVNRLKQEGNPNGWVLQYKFSIAGSTIITISSSGIISLYQKGKGL